MTRVLVVEDDPVAADAHRAYVERVDGFDVAGVALSMQEAVRLVQREQPDLVLLDMHLPDGHGLDLLRSLRTAGRPVDVVAVTSVRDLDMVRQIVSLGVVAYLIKPFTFTTFEAKLRQFAEYRRRLEGSRDEVDQHELDALLGALRPDTSVSGLPKGIGTETLDAVRDALRDAGRPLSASEVADALGASRVTARRYLEFLADRGTVRRATRLGGTGRPEVEYAPEKGSD